MKPLCFPVKHSGFSYPLERYPSGSFGSPSTMTSICKKTQWAGFLYQNQMGMLNDGYEASANGTHSEIKDLS